MKTNISYILFVLCLLLISRSSVKAGNYSWTGTTSVSWSTSTNWNPTGVPSTNDTVTITNQTLNPKIYANTTVKKLTISSGTLNLNSYTLTLLTD